jgi:hypothetical protein
MAITISGDTPNFSSATITTGTVTTLTTTTISDGTNSTSSTNAIQGSAKAWVNFNGVTTATIRGSYNTSSITRNSAGNYTMNFTIAMPNTNYASIIQGGAENVTQSAAPLNTSAYTTTAFNFLVSRSGVGAVDCEFVSVAIFS